MAEFPSGPEEQCKQLEKYLAPHLNSFNWAVTEGFQQLPNWIPTTEVKRENSPILKFRLTDIHLERPFDSRGKRVYPAQCRLAGKTYGGLIQLHFEAQYADQSPKTLTINCNDIPVMVNSIKCNLRTEDNQPLSPMDKAAHMEELTESGGFFVASGHEKILRLLILNRANYVFAIQRASYAHRGANFSSYATSIRSMAPDCSSVTTNLHYLTTGDMLVLFPVQRRMFFVPLPLVLRALVECDDRSIYLSITENSTDSFINDRVLAMLRYASSFGKHTRHEAREFLGAHFGRTIGAPSHYTHEQICEVLLQRFLFPHLSCHGNSQKDAQSKFDLLVFMAKRLLHVVKGDVRPDNMDALTMHELLTPGPLYLATISDAIQDMMRMTAAVLLKDTAKDLSDIDSVLYPALQKNASAVESRMHYLFSMGTLRSNSTLGLSQVEGLSVIPERINYMRYLAHFRSVHRGMFFTQMKTTAVRKLLPESWGFMCPVHTPDGGLCGLLNHLARHCEVVTGFEAPLSAKRAALCVLAENGLTPLRHGGVPVIIDGEVVGSIPESLVERSTNALKAARLSYESTGVSQMTEIVLLPSGGFTRSLYVFTTSQRMMRPVFNINKNATEFIGPLEQIFMDIAPLPHDGKHLRPQDSGKAYAEVHPTSMMSLVASLTPFSDFNQSPRNMYQCQMAKQTMGVPSNSESCRVENKTYHIHYPQRPIVRNDTQDSCGLLDFPAGTNACVAVLSYTGYDMEDALLVNKASVERGFGHGCIYKTHRYTADEIEKGGIFTNEKDGQVIDPALDIQGLPIVGTHVSKGTKILRVFNAKEQKERYMRYRDGEDGFVDQVIVTGNEKGEIDNVTIKFRMIRTPTIGDKFSARHGQKGVFSFPWPQENMPFTENGIVPDVIINPHAFPSRMTIAMLIESMAGKVQASDTCKGRDATPFQFNEERTAADEVGKQLVDRGYNYYGQEVMYSGITGEQFKVDIFFGVVYYQRLRHMVGDKYQVRALGRMNNITRQPLKGRKKGGGIRLGEMERDGLLGQGVMFLIRDRFMWCSDGHIAQLCPKCGSFMFTHEVRDKDDDNKLIECSCCHRRGGMEEVFVPYVLRYLVAELNGMNIKVKFTIDHNK